MKRQIPGRDRPSEPLEAEGDLVWSEPGPVEEGTVPTWDGFEPPDRRKDPTPSFPIQKALRKLDGLYEGIERAGDRWMRLACDLARGSVEEGGGPFGAVILQVDDATGRILRHWTGNNRVVASHDPTAHAEVVAIRAACASLGVFDLGSIRQPGETSHCVIYSSAEPCPMCYAAIRWAKLKALHFAATRFDAAVPGVEFSDLALYEEMAEPYARRAFSVHQCTVGNALDAFNLWKRSDKTPY